MTDKKIDEQPSHAHLHLLSEAWSRWATSRKLFGPPSSLGGTLGSLRQRGFSGVSDGPDAYCSAELSAFHLAVLAQPANASRLVFEAHYVLRVSNIKSAAAQLKIGRASWYRLLVDFQRRAYAGSRQILAHNEMARLQLPSQTAANGCTADMPDAQLKCNG